MELPGIVENTVLGILVSSETKKNDFEKNLYYSHDVNSRHLLLLPGRNIYVIVFSVLSNAKIYDKSAT